MMQLGWRGRAFHLLRSVTPARSFTNGWAALELRDLGLFLGSSELQGMGALDERMDGLGDA